MAATERVSMVSTKIQRPFKEETADACLAGLRIGARTTTASLSDYPEWNMEELLTHRRNLIVTDGSCS